MRVNKQCVDLVKAFEGCLLNAYICPSGHITIGFGATYYEDGSKIKMGDKITQEMANSLLQFQLNEFSHQVSKLIKQDLTANQFSALVSFAFNLGINALAKSTLLKKVNVNPNDKSIEHEFCKWVNAGGKKLSGLVRRRNAESKLYFS